MVMIETKEPSVFSDEVMKRASKIKVLLMDVDGVLTDGRLFYLKDHEDKAAELKAFNSHDGLGLHFLNAAGIKTGVISGRISFATEERARILKMTYVYQGHLEKIPLFEEVLAKEGIKADEAAFIGDDFTDVPLMQRSGLGCAVQDARPEVKDRAHFVSSKRGGRGAVREIAELILKSQGQWEKVLAKYEML
jgi:3-deoxy-D-manno-octulosonate 8-phosphate phosphatase (KDO 8-P phosphatase)